MVDPLYRESRKFSHLTSGTNILRATGESAWLHRIIVNTGVADSITVYNNGAASGEVVAVITMASSSDKVVLDYDVRLDNGLTVLLGDTMDVTVIYE